MNNVSGDIASDVFVIVLIKIGYVMVPKIDRKKESKKVRKKESKQVRMRKKEVEISYLADSLRILYS